MKFLKLAVASAALLAVVGAQAQVVISKGSAGGSFLSLSTTGNLGGIAQVTGGYEVLAATTPSDTMPVGTVGNFLSVEANQTATLTFSTAVSYLSFLWGSADSYNVLTLLDSAGVSHTYSASSFGLSPTDGTAGGQYVQFVGTNGIGVKSLTYSNNPTVNSFETANYSVSAVPEPETYALMLGGLGLVGFMARRRRG